MKRITIKEIAKKAGVSVGTVDRVLHNRGDVAEKTRKLVLKIAEEGNYSTNVYARTLKLNKTFNIGVVIPQDNDYWQALRRGIDRAAVEYESLGLTVQDFVFNRHDQQSFLDKAHEAMELNPEGIILSPLLDEAAEICVEMDKAGIPYVFVDSDLKEANPLSIVGQDTVQSGYLAASLMNYGYEHGAQVWVVKYSDFDLWNKTVKERIKGFYKFYEENEWDRSLIQELELIEGEDVNEQLDVLRNGHLHVFVPNSRSNQVVRLFRENTINNLQRMIGYDLTKANAEVVDEGVVDFIINQNPIQQGYLSIQALYKKLIAAAPVDRDQFMPIEIVTKENLKYTNRFYL